jgi:hypothetical protein
MTTPDDNELPPEQAELAARGAEQIRKMIQDKLATRSPEEGRAWCERKLAKLVGDALREERDLPRDPDKE